MCLPLLSPWGLSKYKKWFSKKLAGELLPRQSTVDDQRIASQLSQVFPLTNSFIVIPIIQKISWRRSNHILRVIVDIRRRCVASWSDVIIDSLLLRRIIFRRIWVSALKFFKRCGAKTSDLSLKIFQHTPNWLKPNHLSALTSAILEENSENIWIAGTSNPANTETIWITGALKPGSKTEIHQNSVFLLAVLFIDNLPVKD